MRQKSVFSGLLFMLLVFVFIPQALISQVLGQRGRRVDENKVEAVKDLPYQADDNQRHRLDLYLPKEIESQAKRPVVVWIHGGGWRAGSKDGGAPAMAGLLNNGFAVACINYRLSAEAPFPAQILDCKSAIRWLRANADKYSLDTERFAAFGSSAGGHLAALVGTSGDVKEFDKGLHLEESSRVQAVCDFYGPTDFSVFIKTPGFESHAGPRAPEALLMGGTLDEKPEVAKSLNPVTHVSSDDPAFLIVHGTVDRTVPLNQSEVLFAALKKNGTAVHFHQLEGAGHGGPGFATAEVSEMVLDFFNQKLKADNVTNVGSAKESSAKVKAEKGNPGRQRTFAQLVNRLDQDGDGLLSKSELPAAMQQQGRFERLDLNGDGKLDEAEHNKFTANRNNRGRNNNRGSQRRNNNRGQSDQ